jgi:hypothetical protein
MQEVELTAQRLLSIWWLILWRGSIGGAVLGVIAGGIIGFVLTIAGHPELVSVAASLASFAVAPFWGLLVVHMSMKKKYGDFRIVLVSP